MPPCSRRPGPYQPNLDGEQLYLLEIISVPSYVLSCNSYEQIRSFANKNEVRVNEVIKIRKNEVTTSFLIHENEFVIPNSW